MILDPHNKSFERVESFFGTSITGVVRPCSCRIVGIRISIMIVMLTSKSNQCSAIGSYTLDCVATFTSLRNVLHCGRERCPGAHATYSLADQFFKEPTEEII